MQVKYAKIILQKFDLAGGKQKRTSMDSKITLDLVLGGKLVDQKHYKETIGSLLYLIASRPNILFGICLCARFRNDHKESHLTAIKKIFRYTTCTLDLGLWFLKQCDIILIA